MPGPNSLSFSVAHQCLINSAMYMYVRNLQCMFLDSILNFCYELLIPILVKAREYLIITETFQHVQHFITETRKH
jgi:hypothetical protein